MTGRIKYRIDAITKELSFETSRSSGKGGQHVNKTESRVTVIFDIQNSISFDDKEKNLLYANLKNRLSSGVLRVSCQDGRSQHTNKEKAIHNLLQLLDKALYVPKTRKKKTISKTQKAARLAKKKIRSDKKSLRKKIRKEDL